MKYVLLTLFVALVACTPGGGNNATPSGTVSLEPVATGLDNPLYVTNSGSGKDLYVVEKTGKVKILENATTLRSTPFLDLAGQLDAGDPLDASGERGLLSIAFHPKYVTNNFVYAYYTTKNGDLTVSRFTVDPSTRVAGNKLELLSIPHPRENHNGGQLQFGQDGFLYVSTGDGGSGGDPDKNGQNKQTLLGKILRIDVDKTDPGLSYAIPDGNPFKGSGGAKEVWAYGLRNPWRFSFDRSNGDLWIGDVGQGKFEEVNLTPKGSSAPRNYGWNLTEGKSCYESTTCDKAGIDLPILDYTHDQGNNSITGGYVYRGTASPKIFGKYIYADFGSGRIWSLVKSANNFVNTLELDTNDYISSFGEGADGELYVVDLLGGKVSRLLVK